jgi:hypothetical protein
MSSFKAPVVLGMAWLALVGGSGLRAADPPKSPTGGWLDPLRYREAVVRGVRGVSKSEFAEMVTAVLNGSQLGPGEGWFKPGQSRYNWQWLAKRHGISPTKYITRKEFKGPAELFERLDRNHDGVLSADDFDWSDRSMFARASMPSRFWFGFIDTNSNGRISREEWNAYFTKLSKGKDYLTRDDLREGFPVMPPARPPNAPPPKDDGPSPLLLILGLLSGELGSPFPGPRVGQMAPDFTLRTQDGKRSYSLSQFRGQKPVVLVLGSFT